MTLNGFKISKNPRLSAVFKGEFCPKFEEFF
jgi:hypothetical protein